MKTDKKLKKNCSSESLSWLPLLLVFRLAFRSLIFLDLDLAPVFFLNIPLFLKMSNGFVLVYLIGMLIAEIYLISSIRKGSSPLKLLLVYFILAVIFEFPCVSLKGLLNGNFSGIFFFVLPCYLSALVGLVITLKEARTKSP